MLTMRSMYRNIVFAFSFLVLVAISASAQPSNPKGKIPSDLKITLERTMCYGTCPDYTLTITADLKVVFKGGHYTKRKGSVRSTIAKASLLELIKEFERVDLSSFADDYSQGPVCEGFVTDMPSEIISIRMDGKTNKVIHYFGCTGKDVREKLKPLTALGKTIDRVTNSQRWVGRK